MWKKMLIGAKYRQIWYQTVQTSN